MQPSREAVPLGTKEEKKSSTARANKLRANRKRRRKTTRIRKSKARSSTTQAKDVTDTRMEWYSISAEYKPIPMELRRGRGEWYLEATLIREFRGPSGKIQTEKIPLGSIDFDNIDSMELRQAFYATADNALDTLELPRETREEIAAELRLVVRPPDEETPKRPRIGLGAVLPDDR